MRSFTSLVTIILAATPALAFNVINGVIQDPPPGQGAALYARAASFPQDRKIEDDDDNNKHRKRTSRCNKDEILKVMRREHECSKAKAFCSSYIQPKVTRTITTPVTKSSVQTKFSTVPVSVTTTVISLVQGPTVTCAATASGAETCNFPAFGFATYLISQTIGVDPVQCHLNCLADLNCKSFQVQNGGAGYCNLFNVPTAGNVQPTAADLFYFYDRNCLDLLPPQCTPAPIRKRHQPTPAYLASVPGACISSACSCLIKTPSPTITRTAFAPSTRKVVQTTTAVVSSTYPVTIEQVITGPAVIYTAPA